MWNRSKAWASTILLAAFISGAVVGGVAVNAWATYQRTHRPSYAERLERELSLTAQQRDSVNAIVKSYEPRLNAAWEAFRPARDSYHAHRDTVIAEARARIASLLTDAQKPRYQELTARSDSARRAHEAPPARTHDSATTHAH